MNVLTTESLALYRAWVKAELAANPTDVAATIETAMEAYDLTLRDTRLKHALKNLQNQVVLGGPEGGEINSTGISGGGTGYVVGDHIQVTGGGVQALVVVTGVDAPETGVITELTIADAGQGYTSPTLVSTAAGDGNATLTATATAISKVSPSGIVDTIIAGL
jgi:hypothetical protein